MFNRARLCRRTEIEVSSGSQLLALEWLVLGRPAHGEKISGGSIKDSWRVKRRSARMGRNLPGHGRRPSPLSRKALLSDCAAIATLLYFGPEHEARLRCIRDHAASLECHCGATLVGKLVVARFAAKDSCELRAALRSLLEELGKQRAPGPFRVPKMWSC